MQVMLSDILPITAKSKLSPKQKIIVIRTRKNFSTFKIKKYKANNGPPVLKIKLSRKNRITHFEQNMYCPYTSKQSVLLNCNCLPQGKIAEESKQQI